MNVTEFLTTLTNKDILDPLKRSVVVQMWRGVGWTWSRFTNPCARGLFTEALDFFIWPHAVLAYALILSMLAFRTAHIKGFEEKPYFDFTKMKLQRNVGIQVHIENINIRNIWRIRYSAHVNSPHTYRSYLHIDFFYSSNGLVFMTYADLGKEAAVVSGQNHLHHVLQSL